MKFRLKDHSFLQEVPPVESWKFVELFYKGYNSCRKVTIINDLQMFIDGEMDRADFHTKHEFYVQLEEDAIALQKAVEEEVRIQAMRDFIMACVSGEIILTKQ